jgi:hypothetical protein
MGAIMSAVLITARDARAGRCRGAGQIHRQEHD